MKRSMLIAAIALLALAFWLSRQHFAPRSDVTTPAEGGTQRLLAPGSVPPSFSPSASLPSATGDTPLATSTLADALNSPAHDTRADLQIVEACLENFRSNFRRDGNPVGNNAEITAALTGKNKLRYAVIPPNHPAINRDGELCDRWGTPFFFHAESATHMSVRSAGPNKKMWTEDDVVFSP